MRRFKYRLKLIFDTLAVFFAWNLSYFLRFHLLNGTVEDSYPVFFKLSFLVFFVSEFLLLTNRLYSSKTDINWTLVVQKIFAASLETFFVISTVFYFFFNRRISRFALLIFLPLQFVFLCISRNIVANIVSAKIKKGVFQRRTLLVGFGTRLNEFTERIKSIDEKQYGNTIIGQYLGSEPISGIKQLEGTSLSAVIKENNIDTVFISFPSGDEEIRQRVYLEASEILNARVMILPDIPKSYAGQKIVNIMDIPVIQINSSEISQRSRIIKRAFDIVSCSLAVIILSPLFILISLAVKLSSKGPVFFKQKRVTKDGVVFNMLKFRSMRIDMPEQNGPHFTEVNDPRVTLIGKLLRKTSLDEIPQFFNVISGSMSLIGPRPERPELVEKFKKEIPGYDIRHKMKAGITGWAQVNGLRGNTSISKRIDFDLFYINHWTLMLDIKIIFLTFFKGFINKNAY